MKKYVLYGSETYAYDSEIKNGVCQDHLEECEVQAEFKTKEEALEALSKKTSSIYSNYTEGEKVNVIEYFVDEEELDEEGDIISSETIAYAGGLQ